MKRIVIVIIIAVISVLFFGLESNAIADGASGMEIIDGIPSQSELETNDIRFYGAVEDGETNNAVAIQAAFDAAEQDAVVNRGRGVVLIPTVTGLGYLCDADIQLKDQILITGGGMIEFSGAYGFESNAKSGWVIDGITILGSRTTGQVGVYIHNSSVKWWIQNCQFYDIEIGIFGTKTFIGRITDNDMYLIGTLNTSCIKFTSGEGNCSKGTAYGTVNDIKIRGNMFKEFGDPTSTEPLIWIGDSTLAPVAPQNVTHAKGIDISANEITGKYAANAIKLENTRTVTIERNWFERFTAAPVYVAGQSCDNTIIRGNGFFGNLDDDSMDPVIQIDSSNNFDIFNVAIQDNTFNRIYTNHNYIEAVDVVGLVIAGNRDLVATRISLTDCTAVDVTGQLVWNHVFDTFGTGDATPSVKFRTLFNSFNGAQTITAFDDGIVGQTITIISKNAIVYDTTTANDATHDLDGSSVDITTAAADVTRWIYDGTSWTLLSFTDVSADWSGGL